MANVLIIDDEQAVCWSLERALAKKGHQAKICSTAEEGIRVATASPPDLFFLDVRLPGMDGLSALSELKRISHDAPVIVMTAFGNLDTAVRAVSGGAFDYLAKPFSLEQAIASAEKALQRGDLQNGRSTQPTDAIANPGEIVGQSAAMQQVFKRIALVAARDASVLITGESGTGKDLVARAIHRHSARREKPLLPINVAALNPGLIESELFGHVRGAFTGAHETRPGLLQLAEGGTIFLDEVADIPASVQVKLLRVLEHNEVMPVGGSQPLQTNIRVLAATNQDLSRAVAAGSFRHDLYFRLNVFQIHVPPLRDRVDDIPLLAESFLRRIEPKAWPMQETTLRYLLGQPWHGNVRELRNALEHAAILARHEALMPEHFPKQAALQKPDSRQQVATAVREWLEQRVKEIRPEVPSNLFEELMATVEPALLESVMRMVQGNRWAAAQWLGLNRATVRKKLGLYDLDADGKSKST